MCCHKQFLQISLFIGYKVVVDLPVDLFLISQILFSGSPNDIRHQIFLLFCRFLCQTFIINIYHILKNPPDLMSDGFLYDLDSESEQL